MENSYKHHQFAMTVTTRYGSRIVLVTPESDEDLALCGKAIFHGRLKLASLEDHEKERMYTLRRKALNNDSELGDVADFKGWKETRLED